MSEATAGSDNERTEAPPARAKRLSLSEILELVLTKNANDHHDVAITRTASGEVVIDVRASADTVAEASVMAQHEYERLTALYPRGEEADPTVSLSRNAKGDTQVEVKGSGWEVTQAVYDKARRAYPMANGLTAKPGTVA